MLDSIEIKLEVGLGSVTKSVVAMCLSNLTADVKNWSSDVIFLYSFLRFECLLFSQMELSAALNIEAALFNEHVHSWEPLIEPTAEPGRKQLTPWALTCSIEPVSIYQSHD